MLKDKQIIENLGGSARVAELLGFKGNNGTRRVNNWKKRGIPAMIKLQYPDLFPFSLSKSEDCHD